MTESGKDNYGFQEKTLYLCGVDWQHELGETDCRLFKSVEELKKEMPCWEECGILEIKLIGKWIEPQNLFKNIRK